MGGGIFTQLHLRDPPLFYLLANQILYSFYFCKFVILGWQRFLVSCCLELKSVNMYLGQFQWPCLVGVHFTLNFKIVYLPLWEIKSKKKKKNYTPKETVCKSFQIFQREQNWPLSPEFYPLFHWKECFGSLRKKEKEKKKETSWETSSLNLAAEIFLVSLSQIL